MRSSSTSIACSMVAVAALAACGGGGDGGSSGAASSGAAGTSGTSGTGATGRAPFATCLIERDGGSTSSSSRVCAANPALAGCRLCLELPDAGDSATGSDELVCVFACRVGMQDCPSGQTCQARPVGGSDSQGTCRDFAEPGSLGYCR